MRVTNPMGRVLSLVIAVLYMALAYFQHDANSFFDLLGYLILPLACIWFSDEMGNFFGLGLGGHGFARVDESSPPSLIKFMGWVLLLLPILVLPIAYLVTAR